MLSKVVTNYVKSARDLAAALRAHRIDVTQTMRTALSPYLIKDESVPDAGFLLELFARRIDRATEELEAADKAHTDEQSDDAEPRRRRDEASEELRSALLEVKRILQTLYGDDAPATFKLAAELPHDPMSVRRMGADVASALEEKALPKLRIAGVNEVSAAPWITKLKKPLKRLDAASKDVAREAREAEKTLVTKNRALDSFEQAFGAGAAAGWGLLTAVGDKEHAARISMSPRRPSSSNTKDASGDAADETEATDEGNETKPA